MQAQRSRARSRCALPMVAVLAVGGWLSSRLPAQATSIPTRSLPQQPLAWSPRPELLATTDHAMAYDPLRKRVVLFGGSSTQGFNDTWEWDGRQWLRRQTKTSPPWRFLHRMAFDAVRGTVVLFGGWDSVRGRLYDDMWEWDGRDWRPIEVSSGPSPRFAHAMAWDAQRQRLVLFGGSTTAGLFTYTPSADTWEWDGSAWTLMTPPTVPSARFGAAMAYHPPTRRVVLFSGGPFGNPQPDTWAWDGQDWTLLSAVSAPPARSYGAMAHDPVSGSLILYGGASLTDTWAFDSTWQVLQPATTPPDYRRPVMVSDPDRRQIVLFGGLATTPSFSARETWTWDGVGWTKASAPLTPGGTFEAVHVPSGDYVLMFGGARQTWKLSEVGYALLGQPSAPPARWGHGLAYHAGSGQVVMFGGATGGPGLDDTWLWDGSVWTEYVSAVRPAASPTGLVYHSATDKVVLPQGSGSLWEWDPSGWVERKPAFRPRRTAGTFADDPRRGRLVLFGVLDANGIPVAETWEWDGVQWYRPSPAQQPPVRCCAFMSYVPALEGVLMFGGTAGRTPLVDTWLWDGADWTELPIVAPPVTGGVAPVSLARDVGRQRLLLFYSFNERFPSVWELSMRTLTASEPEPRSGERVSLDVAVPHQANQVFILGLSGSTFPGIPLRPVAGGMQLLPLAPDPLLVASLGVGLVAVLDAEGRASFVLRIPNDPRWLGARIHAAGFTLGAGLSVGWITNEQPLLVVP